MSLFANDLITTEPESPEIFTSNDESHPYTIFYNGAKYFVHVAPNEALALEIILNKTEYARPWIELGNILFEWRIDPNLWKVTCAFHYVVSGEQFNWISSELEKMRK